MAYSVDIDDYPCGYDEDFVTPLPEELRCAQCLKAYRNPVQMEVCGHNVCESCHEKHKLQRSGGDDQNSIYCVRCNCTRESYYFDYRLTNQVESLQVRCRATDCKWKGKLKQIEEHMHSHSCPFSIIGCDKWLSTTDTPFTDDHGHLAKVQQLKQDYDCIVDIHEKMNALHNRKVEKLLRQVKDLEAKIDEFNNEKDAKATTLGLKLLEYARRGDTRRCEQILLAGVDVNFMSNNQTALMVACGYDQASTVVLLLAQENIDIEKWDNRGFNALMKAAEHGRSKCISLLIKKGAMLNAQKFDGGTALHLASLKGHSGVVEQLMQAGADVTMRNDKGQTAADVARIAARKRVVFILTKDKT